MGWGLCLDEVVVLAGFTGTLAEFAGAQAGKQQAVRIGHWPQICCSVKICWHGRLVVFLIPAVANRNVVCQARFEFSAGGFWPAFEFPEMSRAIPRALAVGGVCKRADEPADVAVVVERAGAVDFVYRDAIAFTASDMGENNSAVVAFFGFWRIHVLTFWAAHDLVLWFVECEPAF